LRSEFSNYFYKTILYNKISEVKIGFDAKRYFNNNTGLGNYSRTLIQTIQKFSQNIEIHLYTPKLKTKNVTNFKIHTYVGIFPKFFGLWWRNKGIIKDLMKDQIEIFHGLSHELPKGISKTKIKTVVSFHDLIFLRFPEQYPFIDRFFYKKKYLRSCKEADVIVAISQQTKLDLIHYFKINPSKIEIIYQTCSIEFVNAIQVLKSKELIPNKDYYLSVGSIIERKNLFKVLKTMKSLSEHGVEIYLKVVGNQKSDYAKECIQFARHNHLNVEFLSNVNTNELAKLYYFAKALVYVSIFEGFGIPILEALHANTPSLVSTGTCFEEVGGNSSFYVDPNDENAIAEGFLWLEDEQNRDILISEIPKQLEIFNPKLCYDKWNELYKKI
jgi:glycosyltransferase involved in cell wall biosynthesis